MSIEIYIVHGPLPSPPPIPHPSSLAEAGAVVCFEGVVRPMEQGRALAALDYEVYEPMTTRELERLARHVRDEHRLIAMRIEHSRGRVPVGECSFRLRIASPHRKAALAAMDTFIDRMKQDVPIWKVPVWRDEP